MLETSPKTPPSSLHPDKMCAVSLLLSEKQVRSCCGLTTCALSLQSKDLECLGVAVALCPQRLQTTPVSWPDKTLSHFSCSWDAKVGWVLLILRPLSPHSLRKAASKLACGSTCKPASCRSAKSASAPRPVRLRGNHLVRTQYRVAWKSTSWLGVLGTKNAKLKCV